MNQAPDHPWTATPRVLAPQHLKNGVSSSSFARSSTYSSTTPSQSSTPASTTRSGFATKPRAKPRWSSSSQESESELPPTLSLRGASLLSSNGSLPNSASDSAKTEISHTNSVIAFGFPPGKTQQILQFFGQFGEIAEQQPGTPQRQECGRNWLRITFRTRESAERALAQNGHVMPGQYVIGCVKSDPSDPGIQSITNSLLIDSALSEENLLESEADRIVPKQTVELFSKPEQKRYYTVQPEPSVPKSFFGKLLYAAANFLFGWDS